ncbi:MAG: aminotransferase class III-fold pyridoxal phosphate-dependent enzyme [Burkholderiaceae bacterium]|nr:aminotransferase class III-fold pyridoxal phosphate-dependent enzyme [Burkholderiaceae bacterium]MDP4968578.1 aminotransferase class III-fold pyridoxal phosphate-dependent enzyme [Burkholderiaceae bacterium]
MTILLLLQYTIVTMLVLWLGAALLQRLQLSLAKSPGLGGHLRWAKRIAGIIRGYSYSEKQWLSIDGAPTHIVEKRKNAFLALSQTLREKSPNSLADTAQAKKMLSDLQLTSRYRVPFQFREVIEKNLMTGSFYKETHGVWLTDLDGQTFIDVSGSYGVNLFGQDFYKNCIREGSETVQALGPQLGGYHPCVLDNARRITELSGMDEVTFHMSGTEAVMQAVRVARYHTRRNKIVRFTSAYHGWWDDVQPGPGNPMPPSPDTLTLRDMHQNTLRVLRRRRDIACVLINPIQAMHPNRAAPTDSMLVDGSRQAHYDREAYTAWLKEVREVCTERGIVLIFDEVFMGFRLAKGGAQEYFGIRADMATYGKTLGGGLPIGVLCGQAELMKRFRDNSPADLCFSRGTFNAHPYVMGAMNSFLKQLDRPEINTLYDNLDQVWSARKKQLNARLKEENIPLRMEAMSTVWTVIYDVPSRYNWMLQYYLRKHGIALSWVGTGRLIFNLGFSDTDFEEFSQRFVNAAKELQEQGWWWISAEQTNKNIKRSVALELLKARLK